MRNHKKTIALALGLCALAGVSVVLTAQIAFAHCQIPCGIYDDPARFTELREHITTIEKSMTEMATLSTAPGENANQLVRWVMNKEQHADEFAHIVSYYFLQQRVKAPADASGEEKYVQQLKLCHQMLTGAMKCKQTADLQNAAALRQAVDAFEKAYLP